MISIASSKNQRLRVARPNTVLVLEPPRHTRWPLVFLGPGKHLIGTSPDSAIQIDAEGVQPRHAMILVGDQKILLKALDPKTWVNDGAATETMIRPGDRISIGPITFLARPATSRELEDYQQSAPAHGESSAAPEPENIATTISPEPTPAPEAFLPAIPLVNDIHDHAKMPLIPLEEEAPRPSPETAFQEIHRHLESLNEPIIVPQIAPARTTMEDESRLKAREEQLNQLAGELARQSQRLRDQTSRIAEREAELERKQAAIAQENERLITAAQSTRQELADEHARQMTLWQEWDSAYKRTSEELKQQLQAIEKRRADLQAENERLAVERSEIQRRQAECQSEHRLVATERVQTTNELGELHAMRAAFETERRQLLVEMQEREAALANERRMLAETQDQLHATHQQFEHERTLFATERSAESLRREQEIHEQTLVRIRLTDQETELQAKQLELDAALRRHEEDQADLERERSLVQSERAEIEEIRVRMHQLETELEVSRQSVHELQASLNEARLDADTSRADLEATLRQHESNRADWENEQTRNQAEAEQDEVDDLRSRMHQLESELESSRQSQHDLQEAMEQLRLDMDRATAEAQEGQHTIELQRTQLDTLRSSLEQEQQAVAEARAELAAVLQHGSGKEIPVPPASPEPVDVLPLVPPAVERLMGIVPEPESNLPLVPTNSDPLPSYFGQGNSSHFKHPTPHSADSFFSSVEPHVETNREHSDPNDAPGYGAMQLSTQPMRAEPKEDGGPHYELESEESTHTTDDIIASTVVDDVTSDVLPDVDRTLTEVNEQFGYVSSLLNHYLSPLAHDFDAAGKPGDSAEAIPNDLPAQETHASPERPLRAADDSLPSLRAQLAEMFDLPENPQMAMDSMKQSGLGLDGADSNQLSSSRSLSILDDIASKQDQAADRHEIEPSSLVSAFTKAQEADSQEKASAEQETSEQELKEEEPWERRLRELAEAGEPNPPPEPKTQEEPPANEPEPTAETEDEFSIEAQLARLLGRPYRPDSPAPEKPQPVTITEPPPVPVESSPIENDSSPSVPSVDRSHLNEAPKHKTDRSAVRDEVQSFREVAQISARTALAKHSWNTLKNEFYFISLLTAASSIAATWYLGTFIAGMETDPWKGVTCAIATMLCSHRLVKASAKLNQWRRTNRKNKKQDADVVPSAPPQSTAPKPTQTK